MLLPSLLSHGPGRGQGLTSGMEQWNVGAVGPEFQFSHSCRIPDRRSPYRFYFAKLLFTPHPLTFIYPRWHIDPHSAWQWVFPAGVAISIAILWLIAKTHQVAVRWWRYYSSSAHLFSPSAFVDVYPMRWPGYCRPFSIYREPGIDRCWLAACGGLANLPFPGRIRNFISAAALLVTLRRHDIPSNPSPIAPRCRHIAWHDTLDKESTMLVFGYGQSTLMPNEKGDFNGAFGWYDRSSDYSPRSTRRTSQSRASLRPRIKNGTRPIESEFTTASSIRPGQCASDSRTRESCSPQKGISPPRSPNTKTPLVHEPLPRTRRALNMRCFSGGSIVRLEAEVCNTSRGAGSQSRFSRREDQDLPSLLSP